MRSAAEKRKSMGALEFPLDELGYPSDNEVRALFPLSHEP
jgi:hypothetical protein